MPNIRNASTSNIVFPSCNICEKSVIDKDDAIIQCDICQALIHLKCKLNHINNKYLQGSNDPWFCLYCCSSIFPFGFLTNKDFLSTLLYGRNVSENGSNKNSSIYLTPLLNFALLFNLFNSTSPEQDVAPENVVNSRYFDVDERQALKLLTCNINLKIILLNQPQQNPQQVELFCIFLIVSYKPRFDLNILKEIKLNPLLLK